MTPRQAVTRSWLDYLGHGPVGLGLDLATTDKQTSNPASLVVMEKAGGRYWERLVIAWKTRDERVTEAVLEMLLEDIAATGTRPRGVAVDASNETFFAQGLARRLRRFAPFHLIKGGEHLTHQGETLPAKELLGNLYVNAHQDGLLATPEGGWIKKDRRLVKRDKGRFYADTGRQGQHADTFDAGKLALWTFQAGGPAQAHAAGFGGAGSNLSEEEREDLEADGPAGLSF